jgi:hypothetical protein
MAKIRKADTDIDIDFQDPKRALMGLDYIRAVIISDDGNTRPHQSGIFFQDVPHDPITKLSTINNEDAENRGYFKLDFLSVHQYDGIRNEDHLVELMNKEPLWEMLEDDFFIKHLSQIHNHSEVVMAYKPKTVMQLAMVLAMIRPAKSHLRGLDWDKVEENIWVMPQPGDNGYEYIKSFFKKSHSVSYSLAIVVQMNLMVEQND